MSSRPQGPALLMKSGVTMKVLSMADSCRQGGRDWLARALWLWPLSMRLGTPRKA
jgi:hypothetical protein